MNFYQKKKKTGKKQNKMIAMAGDWTPFFSTVYCCVDSGKVFCGSFRETSVTEGLGPPLLLLLLYTYHSVFVCWICVSLCVCVLVGVLSDSLL